MHDYILNKEGYIVFEDGGISPTTYGASEKWFQTYDEATNYALSIITKRIEELKTNLDANSVIIYEGPESLLHETHEIPGNRRVIFEWRNYYSARK